MQYANLQDFNAKFKSQQKTLVRIFEDIVV